MPLLTSGDAVDLDLSVPLRREAVLRHPAVVVTAQGVLDESPNVVQVIPLTSTLRGFSSEVIDPDEQNRQTVDFAGQCQHVRSVSMGRVESVRGNIGSARLSDIRRVLGLLMDIS